MVAFFPNMFNPVRVCLPLCSTEWKMEGLGDMFWLPVLIHPVRESPSPNNTGAIIFTNTSLIQLC